MKKLLRILYILIFVLAAAFVFTYPVKTETNILRAVFSNSSADETVVKLSGRYSSKINVLIESESPENSEAAASEFYNSVSNLVSPPPPRHRGPCGAHLFKRHSKISLTCLIARFSRTDKNSFAVENFDFINILGNYKIYHKNLLAPSTALKLENHKYNDVMADAFGRLYDPLGFMLLPLNEDPFLLFTDYIKSLGGGEPDSVTYNDKYYNILSLEVKNDKSLSPELLNGKIKELVNLQSQLSKDDVKVYLTGAPVHSYYASSKSMIEINIICILSSLFIIGLCYFYFRNLKLLLPIAVSLGAGMLSGYFAASLVFSSIHVLTFVFSTTLIGICIDYSLHYFIEKDLSKIFKSLTVSMITTVSAFGVLLFSGVELLRQIAVFTMTGLFSVYLIIVLFYPLLKFQTEPRKINLNLSDKAKKIIAVSVFFVSVAGMFFVKFNDDIRNMYVPSKKLLAAEKLFAEVTGGDRKTSFAVVEGRDFQDLLRKEEWIARNLQGADYQALSKFIPSEKQQKKNFELRHKLYNKYLKSYAGFLSEKEITALLDEKAPQDFLKYNETAPFSQFLLGENTSVMILYDFDRPEIITQNGGKYIDVQRDISERIKDCRKACVKMLLPVFAILFLLLSIIYKPKTAAKILTPSILSGAFAIGLLSITGQEINLFHILAIFLIIGFGLDYSVFRAGGVKHSRDAVLLSCATSVFSFLLLSFTSFKLISSLGFILSVGLSVSYLTSLLFDYSENEK